MYMLEHHKFLPEHLNTIEHVQVPRSKFSPCSSLLGQLAANIDPFEVSHDFGRAKYTATTQNS